MAILIIEIRNVTSRSFGSFPMFRNNFENLKK